MHHSTLTLLGAFAALAVAVMPAGAASRGVQASRDGTQIFINKDATADQRWAITRNLATGALTGNIFFRDGSSPSFLVCEAAGDGYDCRGATSCFGNDAAGRGVQVSPDGGLVFVNKDVPPNQRWAITLDRATAKVTGNIFFQDESQPPGFIDCEPTSEPFAYTCFTASTCVAPPCGQYDATTIAANPGSSFFALPFSEDACVAAYGGSFHLVADDALRAFLSLPTESPVTGIIEGVRDGQGNPGQLEVGLGVIPSPEAAAAIARLSGGTTAIAGRDNGFSVEYDASDLAAAPAAADDLALLVTAFKSSDETQYGGAFVLPLEAVAGRVDVTVAIAESIGVNRFRLAFAVRRDGVTSQIDSLAQTVCVLATVCAPCSGGLGLVHPQSEVASTGCECGIRTICTSPAGAAGSSSD